MPPPITSELFFCGTNPESTFIPDIPDRPRKVASGLNGLFESKAPPRAFCNPGSIAIAGGKKRPAAIYTPAPSIAAPNPFLWSL